MGRQQSEQQKQNHSLRSKAVHFVSDLTTVFLNPISDKPSKPTPIPPTSDDETEPKRSQVESISEDDYGDLVDGPDTSSFTAFLYSLLSSSESGSKSNFEGLNEYQADSQLTSEVIMKENSGKKSLFSRGKQSLGRAIYQAARLGGYRHQASAKGSSDMMLDDSNNSKFSEDEGIDMQTLNEPVPLDNLPETSEPSLLLSEKTRGALYDALPALAQGRKWYMEAWHFTFYFV
ncbi:unnamed protein product [Ilex paraguariensis]|uniref:Uncharacterized protein n=1 Tax=Ilex paraguariensis TaxID=185542 RepID=A0ABC8T1E1_9AQUA